MTTVNHQPLVSVVMPVFNAEAYLAEAIDSVIAQTFTDWELLAIEDGSSDQSLAIIQDFVARDDRIRLLQRPHTGIVGARNDGIHAACGKYIAALDNDDGMYPERLRRQVEFLEIHPECAAVGSHALLVDSDGDPMIERRVPISPAETAKELLSGRNPMMQPGVSFRRDALLKIDGYREACEFSEDYDLFLRLSEVGELQNLDEVLLWHRQHVNRASTAQFKQQQQVAAQALKETWDRRGLPGEPPVIPTAWHPDTPEGFHIRCASDAWDGGYNSTVRKHARALWRLNPFSLRAIELYARTLMGRSVYSAFARCKSFLRPLRRQQH